MAVTKLDVYDYTILPGVIRIRLEGTNDPDLVDILSEIYNSKGRIYIDGGWYSYLDNHRVFTDNGETYIDLDVTEV